MSSQKTTQKVTKDAATKSKGGKRLMIDAADFNITKWSNTEIDFEDERNKNSNQFTCYGRYNYGKDSSPVQNQLVFKTEPIKLVTYGIPQLGKFAKTDKERSYIKLPYDTSQDSCVKLFKMFEALDNWAIKNKDKFFSGKLSKFAKIYDYTPIVRKAQEVIPLDDDDDNDTKNQSSQQDKPQYAKIRISTNWESGDVDTTVFVREDGVPVKQDVKTVTDMANFVTWQSTIQMIGSCNKIWFGKSADKNGRRQFGLSFKILQCEVTEKVNGTAKNDFTTYAFDDSIKVEKKHEDKSESDSDSDSESEDEKPVQQTKKTVNEKDDESEDDSESDNDSEDESEDEAPQTKSSKKQPVVVKSSKKQQVEESESSDDSDSDESEDEKPVQKVQSKKTAKSSR